MLQLTTLAEKTLSLANHWQFLAFLAIFWVKTDFLCAYVPKTPDMLLQYNRKQVSVELSPTPPIVNHKVHNEYKRKPSSGQKIGNSWPSLGEN